MGNYRFRLSDIFKPKDMSRADRCQTSASSKASAAVPASLQPPNRASCCIPSKESKQKFPHSPVNTKPSDTRFAVEPTRKTKRKGRRIARKPCADAVSSAVSATCSCCRTPATRAVFTTVIRDVGNDRFDPSTASKSSESDIFHASLLRNFEELDAVLQHKLPPVVTKPEKNEVHRTGGRKSIKVRHNSPRIGSKKVQTCRKHNTAALVKWKPLRESFVMIKSSSNPWRDFEESMLEMIVENNIQQVDDWEELLACYLSLNSKEYHEVIVEVFTRIWFVLTDIKT